MLRVLLQKSKDPNSIVAANVLMCLGELTCVGGEDVTPHVPELMEIILEKLADSSIVKRSTHWGRFVRAPRFVKIGRAHV